jgi:hypothetical protein
MFVKKCDQHDFDAGLLQRKLYGPWWLLEVHCMFRRFVSGHIEIPMTHPQLQCNQENWDCLEKSGWNLGMRWFPVAFAHPWDCVRRTLRRSSSSVNLHGGFEKSSPYWCLIHSTSFSESIDDLMSSFHGHLRLWLHFEKLKDARFLDNPEDPHAHLQIV